MATWDADLSYVAWAVDDPKRRFLSRTFESSGKRRRERLFRRKYRFLGLPVLRRIPIYGESRWTVPLFGPLSYTSNRLPRVLTSRKISNRSKTRQKQTYRSLLTRQRNAQSSPPIPRLVERPRYCPKRHRLTIQTGLRNKVPGRVRKKRIRSWLELNRRKG